MIDRTLRKLYNNILSPRAYSVLGPKQYARLLGTFATELPAILKSRDLRPLDEAMSGKVDAFNYRGVKFKLDLQYCDQHVRDGSFAFGNVREICIRDCYFRFHKGNVFQRARTVVDIGANRGVFSTLMAGIAHHVLCVEAQPHFVPVIQRNMAINGFANYAVECALLGSGGLLGVEGAVSQSMDDLLKKYSISRIDFLKMDIEGSEFSLFKSDGWLDKVNAISMEIHSSYGDPLKIIKTLDACGFELEMADQDLTQTRDTGLAEYLFAVKRPLRQSPT